MKPQELLDALSRKFETTSQSELAKALGVASQTLINWKKSKSLSPTQIASAFEKARSAAVRRSQDETILPVVEFFKIQRSRSKQDKGWKLFRDDDGKNSYLRELKCELDERHGIYIFYDTRGRSLYAGKAKEQSLWKEMNLAFNRKREVQKLTLVRHPERNQPFRSAAEKLRQPKEIQLELCDIAAYFSAYDIDQGMIDNLEALLVRGFANDLLNVRMEKFPRNRK